MKPSLLVLAFLAFGQLSFADGVVKIACTATDPDSGKSIVGRIMVKNNQQRLSISLGDEKLCDSRAQEKVFNNPVHGASYTVKVYQGDGTCSLEVSSIPVEGESGSTYGHANFDLGGSPRMVTVACQSR